MEDHGLSRRDILGTAASLAAGLAPGVAGTAAEAATGGTAGSGPDRIMIIRHAEKPAADGAPPYGVDAEGRHDVEALLVRGWQRAGALVGFFAPRDGRPPDPAIAVPGFLFAAAATPKHRSRRSMLTLEPLAGAIGVAPVTDFGPDEEAAAAEAIATRSGVGLVAWEHKRIGDLVTAVTGGTVAPPHWPGTRYDMVLVLDRPDGRWRLAQVPQRLLAGDDVAPLPFRPQAGEPD